MGLYSVFLCTVPHPCDVKMLDLVTRTLSHTYPVCTLTLYSCANIHSLCFRSAWGFTLALCIAV